MKKVIKKSAVLCLLAIVVGGCGNATGDLPQKDQFIVLATIYPLVYFTERIVGASVNVHPLIGSGVEAHTFEPTPADMQLIASADLIVANGLDFEPWLGRAIVALDDSEIVVVEAALVEGSHQEEEHEHLHRDPHFWLDPVLAAVQVERVRDALSAANPGITAIYGSNAADFLDELAALHSEYEFRLADCSRNHFITTHAAYGYMADRYGLEQISIAGLTPESEPSPRDLADLVVQVRDLGLTHILVESGLSSTIVDTLAAETNLALLPIHPLESVSSNDLAKHRDYLGLMRANLDSLSETLGCVT